MNMSDEVLPTEQVERPPPTTAEEAPDWVEQEATQVADRPVGQPPRAEEKNPEARAMLADVPIMGTEGGTNTARPKFFDHAATAGDVRLAADGVTAEQLERAGNRLNQVGQEPRQMILEAVRNSRVTAIGETHTQPNGLQRDGAQLIPEMKRAGLTHLAVEINKDQQGLLDDFLKGKITRDQFKQKFFGSADTNGQGDDWLQMAKAAHEAGIKVVAVDNYRDDSSIDIRGFDQKTAAQRDGSMASMIGDILDKDPKAKVLFWVGSDHLEAGIGRYGNQTAGELLRQKADRDGFKLTVMAQQLEDSSTGGSSGGALAGMSNRPIGFNTKTAGREVTDLLGARDKKFDNILLYPKDYSLKLLESEVGPNSPALLPKMDQIALSYAGDGSAEKAMAMTERAAALGKRLFGENSPQYVERLTRTGQVHNALKQPDAARASFEAAIAHAGNLPDKNSRELLEAVARWESVTMTRMRYPDLGSQMVKALPAILDNKLLYDSLRRDANRNSDSPKNPLVVADHVIETLKFMGNNDRALQLANRMLEIEKRHELPGSHRIKEREEQIQLISSGQKRKTVNFDR